MRSLPLAARALLGPYFGGAAPAPPPAFKKAGENPRIAIAGSPTSLLAPRPSGPGRSRPPRFPGGIFPAHPARQNPGPGGGGCAKRTQSRGLRPRPEKRRRPPSGRVSSNAKKAREKPGPIDRGAWPMKRCQEGARQRPHPSGKARAHAIRARAASSAPPRATTASRQQPLLRDYRRARSTAVGAAPPCA